MNYLAVFFASVCVILLANCGIVSYQLRQTKKELERAEESNRSMAEKIRFMERMEDIRNDIDRRTKKKVSELHSGNALDNAINGLSKHKN